jgi:protein ImuB
MFACIHSSGNVLSSQDLGRLAGMFTPAFEYAAPDTIVFDIDGLGRMLGGPREIAQAIARKGGPTINVAIAVNPDAAILAARNFPGVTVITGGALATLPVTALPLSDELSGILESWGIHTLGDLAALPEIGLAERFGEEMVRVQRLARGVIERPLKIELPEVSYQERVALDHPIALLEPLLFVLSRILNDQCARLASQALATNEIHLKLELEDGREHLRTLRFPVPLRESRPLLKLLQMDLEAHPPEAATVAVSLTLEAVEPRTVQHGLFLPATPAPDRLELTLARIRGLVGEDNAGIPELLDTHHPHPFRLAAHASPRVATPQVSVITRLAFRYFRPVLQARIEIRNERPVRVDADGIHGKVLTASGPWRTSGYWWTVQPWNRDEWEVALAGGALYRVYRQPDAHWFVEGSYD